METSVATEGKVGQIIEMVESLTVLELAELVKALEERFGVSSAPQIVAAAGSAAAAGDDAAAPADEPTEFDVVLAAIGDQKIQVIKEVRALLGLGLKEAKDVVDRAPGTIKEKVSNEEAEEIKKKLEAVGAVIEIKGV